MNKEMRLGFIRKVYGILSMQLLLTSVAVTLAVTIESFKVFMKAHFELWIVCWIFTIVFLCMLFCCFGKKHPHNYYLLFAFTFCESYVVAGLCVLYDPKTVLMAALLTTGLTIILTLYACFTKKDFTVCMTGMILVGYAFLSFGFFMMLFPPSYYARLFFCCIGVIIYGIYLVIDT